MSRASPSLCQYLIRANFLGNTLLYFMYAGSFFHCLLYFLKNGFKYTFNKWNFKISSSKWWLQTFYVHGHLHCDSFEGHFTPFLVALDASASTPPRDTCPPPLAGSPSRWGVAWGSTLDNGAPRSQHPHNAPCIITFLLLHPATPLPRGLGPETGAPGGASVPLTLSVS